MSVHCALPSTALEYFEPQKAFKNLDFNADPDPASKNNADACGEVAVIKSRTGFILVTGMTPGFVFLCWNFRTIYGLGTE